MDNMRVIGENEQRCTWGMYRIVTLTHYLGEQNAARKCGDPSQLPCLWTGANMETDNKNIYVSTSQDK